MKDAEGNRCPGCGALFQRDEPDAAGYIPDGKIPDGKIVCRRCFQMKHYGILKKAKIKDGSIKKDISDEVSGCSAIFLILDICQFEISSSAIEWVSDLDRPVFVIVNKCDILSKWIGYDDITNWVSERLSIPSNRVFPVSAFNRKAVKDLRDRIENGFPQGSKVILLGTTNVGKSTLLTGLTGDDSPTISRLPGTTLGIARIKSRYGNITYVDVPGLKEVNPWLGRLCPTCLAGLIPQKKLQNYSSVLKPSQALSFGGLGWFVLDEAGDRGWLKIEAFGSDELKFHRTGEERLKELMTTYRDDLLAPPCPSCWSSLKGPEYIAHTEKLHVGIDIVIPGCGWFSVRSGYGSGRIYLPEGVEPIVRPSLIPSENKRAKGSRR